MTQFEKNPNGGYLNKSSYGEDGWYGAITITPELLTQVQATGKVLIEVKDVQTTQYGDCRRIVAKEYVQKTAPTGAPAYAGHAPAPMNNVAVAQAPVAPAPAQAQALPQDTIPF